MNKLLLVLSYFISDEKHGKLCPTEPLKKMHISLKPPESEQQIDNEVMVCECTRLIASSPFYMYICTTLVAGAPNTECSD